MPDCTLPSPFSPSSPARLDLVVPTAARGALGRSTLFALVVASLLAGLLAVASPAAARPRTLAERRAANAVLTMINAERHAHGVAAARPNYRLLVSARRHDVTMAVRNLLSHQLPGEPAPATRITRAGYSWSRCGENIAWTTDTTTRGAQFLQHAMYAERAPNNAHRRNILDRSYREVGVAVLMDRRHHKLWLTVDFGTH